MKINRISSQSYFRSANQNSKTNLQKKSSQKQKQIENLESQNVNTSWVQIQNQQAKASANLYQEYLAYQKIINGNVFS